MRQLHFVLVDFKLKLDIFDSNYKKCYGANKD